MRYAIFLRTIFTKFTKLRTEFNPQIDWTAELNASLRSDNIVRFLIFSTTRKITKITLQDNKYTT